ncbi:probable dehydrogenases with different specificities (related to short-chain alcohol dehydrogenases) [Phialocephala subalpina]|uniref:Probable dehydrogenases with different specificities (Related to short-chain alcohol dehydrogenases) n=1 Tax=Phialocephala subalpina TaxID=576137 RepID=A0A1L7WBJ0_9HELO|nr:probable dehydrogenases with different specificities (related to short-chain alcohol dehydrogenases) [Phialocephala subalpina]
MADNNIAGRLALITGASSGIGAACAKDLAKRGVHLALTYSKSKEAMEKILSDIKTSSPEAAKLRISIHKVDVGVVDDMMNMFQEIQEHHSTHVDILVSNAGYGKRIVDVWDIPLEEFEYTLNVNLRASFVLVKGVIEGMKAQKWGRIIFMSSIAANGGGINGCHYAASKGGLTGMMKNLASKLAPLNISVNDVAPALIGETGMISGPDIIPGGVSTIPMGRLGSPQEVANIVTMLATTGFMTGQSLLIAGGLK